MYYASVWMFVFTYKFYLDRHGWTLHSLKHSRSVCCTTFLHRLASLRWVSFEILLHFGRLYVCDGYVYCVECVGNVWCMSGWIRSDYHYSLTAYMHAQTYILWLKCSTFIYFKSEINVAVEYTHTHTTQTIELKSSMENGREKMKCG